MLAFSATLETNGHGTGCTDSRFEKITSRMLHGFSSGWSRQSGLRIPPGTLRGIVTAARQSRGHVGGSMVPERS